MVEQDPADNTLIFRLKQQMRFVGLTQKQVAAETGITEATLSRYLNGNRIPNALILARLAAVLGVSVDWLLGREPDMSVSEAVNVITRNAARLTRTQRETLALALVNANDRIDPFYSEENQQYLPVVP